MKIFTPNVQKGVAGERFRLFERGDYANGDRAFSATIDGPVFRAKVLADDCGLGCKCGAFIVPKSKHGESILATAEKF